MILVFCRCCLVVQVLAAEQLAAAVARTRADHPERLPAAEGADGSFDYLCPVCQGIRTYDTFESHPALAPFVGARHAVPASGGAA